MPETAPSTWPPPPPDGSIGNARTDITAYEPGQLLFGWSDGRGRAHGVAERLHARAVVIRPTDPAQSGPGAVAIACLDRPWLPGRAHAQVLQVGSLAIVGAPAEPTTIAGRRLSQASGGRTPDVETVVVAGYANGYTACVTTAAEVQDRGVPFAAADVARRGRPDPAGATARPRAWP